MASQNIAGRADVVIGVRDETRAALTQMRNTLSSVLRQTAGEGTRALRPLEQSIRNVSRGGGARGGTPLGRGTGGFGAGGKGAREFGAFGGINQLGFLIEDAAVSAQLSGFSGAVRAGANNLTLMSLAFGGVRAQMLATALVVGAQLAPAFFKMQGQTKAASEIINDFKTQLLDYRRALQTGFDRRELPTRLDAITSSVGATSRISDIEKQIRQKQQVELPAAKLELNTLRETLRKFQASEDKANFADHIGNFGKELFAGAETPEAREKVLNREIKAREILIRRLDDEIQTLGDEHGAVVGRREDLSTAEARSKAREELRGLAGSVIGRLNPLIGRDEAQTRAAAERNRRLKSLFSAAGIDGGGILDDLAAIDRLRLQRRPRFSGLPDTLDESSIAARRQAVINDRRQNDPAVKHLRKIEEYSRSARDKLDAIAAGLTEE